MEKEIKKFTQEEFINSSEFFECEEIYLDKFFLEGKLSLDEFSNLTFYTHSKDGEIIGFGSYQKNNDLFDVADCTFANDWEYSEFHSELFNHILKDNSGSSKICLYQAFEEDMNFYLKWGLKLYKDYGGDWFPIGKDIMRYVLERE